MRLRVCMQVITEGMGSAYLRLKLKDQAKALELLTGDAQLADLRQLRAPLVDMEVRGLPALQYFGGMVWQDAIQEYAAGEAPGWVLTAGLLLEQARDTRIRSCDEPPPLQ